MKIGIDPGLSGAIALLKDDDTLCWVEDMPIMPEGKKMQVNEPELTRIIKETYSSLTSGHECCPTCYLERVSAMPGQGVTSMFNFGVGYGIVRGVVQALGIPLWFVRPVAWKRQAGILHRDKDAARTMAQHLYPAAPLGRVKDIGRADAILIARYGSECT